MGGKILALVCWNLLGNILLLRKNAGKTFTESCNNPEGDIVCLFGYIGSKVIHHTENAQISQKQDGRNIVCNHENNVLS